MKILWLSLFSSVLIHSVMSQVPVLPDQFRTSLAHKDLTADVDFFQFPYKGTEIELKTLKLKYPGMQLPDHLTISPPGLSTFDDVTVLIGVIRSGKGDVNSLVVWLAGNFYSNAVSFYIDRDQDRDFNNDDPPLNIKAGQTPHKIILDALKDGGAKRELWLAVPERKVQIVDHSLNKRGISNKMAIGVSAGIGTGALSYSYDNLDIGFPTTYDIDFTERNLGATFSYDLRRIRFGVSMTFQSLNYYTSYLRIQLGEPFLRQDASGIMVLDKNQEVRTNGDLHTTGRAQLGFLIAGRIRIGSTTELQPLVKVGKTYYINSTYKTSRYEAESFEVSPSVFLETGLRFEFTIGILSAFYIEGVVNSHSWKPKDFLENINHDNYESQYKAWRGTVGYRFAIN